MKNGQPSTKVQSTVLPPKDSVRRHTVQERKNEIPRNFQENFVWI
jgi:hypothetical protein